MKGSWLRVVLGGQRWCVWTMRGERDLERELVCKESEVIGLMKWVWGTITPRSNLISKETHKKMVVVDVCGRNSRKQASLLLSPFVCFTFWVDLKVKPGLSPLDGLWPLQESKVVDKRDRDMRGREREWEITWERDVNGLSFIIIIFIHFFSHQSIKSHWTLKRISLRVSNSWCRVIFLKVSNDRF